jgi:translocation and assembly module TamB
VDAKGKVAITVGKTTKIEAEATTQPFELANNVIPGVDAKATLDDGVWSGSADVNEAGVPAHATFSVDPKAGVRFDVSARAASLRGIRRVPLPVDGAADVRVTGGLKDGVLDAKVSGNVGRVRANGGVERDDGHVEARVRGPLAKLDVDATVTGKGVRAGSYAWETITAHASGPVTAPRVETTLEGKDGEALSASGDIDAKSRSITGVHVNLKRRGSEVTGDVARVAATPAGLSIEGIQLGGKGVGQLEGGLVVQGKELVGKLHGQNVDLGKVAEIAGLHQKIGGLANVDIDLAASGPGQRRGHINIELANGQVDFVNGISGTFSATFAGDHVRTDGLFRLVDHDDAASAKPRPGAKAELDERCDGAIAQVRVTGGDGHLPGPLLEPATWMRAFGKVEVAADDWNLRCIARRAGLDLFLSEVRGKLTTRFTVERAPGGRLPRVHDFLARTRGLAVAGPKDGPGERPEWDSRYTDVELKFSFDPASGGTSAKITLLDDQPIISLRARAVLDIPLLLDHPELRAAALRKTPISGHLSIPRRAFTSFASLPSFVRDRLPILGGEVKVEGDLDGTLDQPNLAVKAEAWDLAHASVVEALPPPQAVTMGPQAAPNPAPPSSAQRTGQKGAASSEKPAESAPQTVTVPAASPWGVPVDITAVATYDGQKATLDTKVIHDGREVANANAELAIVLADLLAGKPFKPAGGFFAKLDKLPLGDIPFFADRGVGGSLSGTLALGGLGDKPFTKVDLGIAGLKIADHAYDVAEVKFDITPPKTPSAAKGEKDPRGIATAKVELSSKTGGRLAIDASSEVIWPNGLSLKFDDARPASVDLRAHKFRIAAAGPFVAGLFSRIDGVLDGEARLHTSRLSDEEAAKIAVSLKLKDGIFHLPQLGQELHGAEISLTGGNGGLVRLDKFRAAGQKGLLTGKGQVRFAGLRFTDAKAEFSIPQGQELPITLEGVPLGDAHGKVSIAAVAKGRELSLDVGIPEFHIDLPAALSRSVQSLDDNPDIYIKDGQPRIVEPKSEGGRRIAINVNLGKLGIKGSILDVTLMGQKSAPIRVELGGEKARVSGDIAITRGRVDVLKKQFEIEQPSIIHMRPEDPGNPYVNVTARWDSPEGPIYIDYVGVLLPVTPEKLKYRSPSIPEDRIIPTLLFGGVEQSTVAGGAQGQAPGQTLAAQLIADQFTTQLSRNASFNLGTREDGTFRPGITYTAGNAIIELSTYGASGNNASSTAGAAAPKGQHSLLTIDWRFWRNWLLRGKVDVGSDAQTTGFDVLWQYRY